MRKIIIPVLIILMITFLLSNKSHAQSGNLVLLNTLGSQVEVENSVVGPDGLLEGGSFMPGVFGNAYVATYNEDLLLSFPTVPFPYPAGAIEFWAKLIGFPPNVCYSGDCPAFVVTEAEGWDVLRFVSNDGHGGGGLSATIHAVNTATGGWGSSWDYAAILGAGKVEDWHHYAVVWDGAGIPDAGNHKIAIYLNGQFDSGYWIAENNFSEGAPGMALLRQQPYGWGSVAIDNIKVWDYAKTDFSDRFIEAPYTCVGFEPPMDAYPVTVKGKNAALPLKAQLLDHNGLPITDTDVAAPPVIQVLYHSGGEEDPIDVSADAYPAGLGTEWNQFEFTDEGKWQYNLKTKNYTAAGTYTILMLSGDDSEYSIDPTCETSFKRK